MVIARDPSGQDRVRWRCFVFDEGDVASATVVLANALAGADVAVSVLGR
jgi:hypothetical protein